MPRLRWVFSISTVASSTKMPTASARPPSVITLMVSCSRLRMQMEVRIDSGIEMQTISVLRQLPRNSRITVPVRKAAIRVSRTTPWTAARTNTRLIAEHRQLQRRRNGRHDPGQRVLHGVDDGERGGVAVARDGEQDTV